MDIATVIGFIAGWGLVASAILMSGSAPVFFSIPSFLITLGGTIASTLINYPLGDVLNVIASVKNAFIHKETPPQALIEKLVSFAGIARREGILSLENHTSESDHAFLRRGVRLAVDGSPPELIKDILTTELAFMEERHAIGQSILMAMAAYAPAFGLIGTLIGLVQMLTRLDNPSEIGSGMALALITTLYGVLLANVVFLPAAGKLKVRTNNELLSREIIIEGILSIQSGENPRIVQEKLKSFVAPSIRERLTFGR